MRPLVLAVTIALCSAVASGAEPGCTDARKTAKNADGSTLTMTVSLCRDDGERRVRVELRSASGQPARTVLRERQSMEEAPNGDASFIDLDNDGRHEVELRGTCGAGPNCEGTIFRLNAAGSKMSPFFRGGYANMTMIDGYVVESGRASCCSWESHAYKVRPDAVEVTEKDLEYRIDVNAEGGEDGIPLVVECSFHRQEANAWTDVPPPSRAWLRLCEQYGKNYKLRKPNQRGN